MSSPNPVGMARGGGAGTPADSKYLSKSFFNYEADLTSSLAPAGSATFTFTISKDADFFWTKFAAHAISASDGTTVSNELLPEVLIQLTNTTTGRLYMSNPTPLANMSGGGRLPFILPMVTLWEAVSTIQIQLQNNSDNATYSAIYLSFLGIKAFLPGRA